MNRSSPLRSTGHRASYASSLAALLAVLATAGTSSGQTAADKAAAQALFDEGKRMMEERLYRQACARFEESQRLDPGIGTLYQLATCQEKLNKTASAWALYVEVASLSKAAGQTAREEHARAEAARLEPSLARLVLKVEGAPGDDFTVERDGAAVGKGQWGVAVPVDPGEHVVEVKVAGYRPFRKAVNVRWSETETVVIVAEVEAPIKKVVEPRAGVNPWRIAAYSAGGAGIASFAASLGFMLSARAKNEDSQELCPDNRCYPEGAELRNQALAQADLSTGFFVTGAALIAAGVGLMFVPAPSPGGATKSVAISPWAGASGGGVLLEGRFQ